MTAKSRATLNSDADTNLADNTAGDIGAGDVRGRVKDLADSAVNLLGDTMTGALGIGTFSDTGASNGKLIATGNHDSSRSNTVANNHMRIYNPNGLVGSIQSLNSATLYNTTSGRDTKQNIRDIDAAEAIAAIMAMNARVYERKVKPGVDERGFIAEELFEVFPEAVSPPFIEIVQEPVRDAEGNPVIDPETSQPMTVAREDTTPWMVDYGKITPLLWSGLKGSLERIDELAARIAALEAS